VSVSRNQASGNDSSRASSGGAAHSYPNQPKAGNGGALAPVSLVSKCAAATIVSSAWNGVAAPPSAPLSCSAASTKTSPPGRSTATRTAPRSTVNVASGTPATSDWPPRSALGSALSSATTGPRRRSRSTAPGTSSSAGSGHERSFIVAGVGTRRS
jgi:hypothetical protein